MSTFISAFDKVYPTIDDASRLRRDFTVAVVCLSCFTDLHNVTNDVHVHVHVYTYTFVRAHHVLNDVGLNGNSTIFDRTA